MSLHYTFPIIHNINDVLPAIKDAKEFLVVDKGDYVVINYVMQTDKTFPTVSDEASAIRRECRGLIFDNNGKLISRPYHKFFNYGERNDSHHDYSIQHFLIEKLDGSMIRPIPLANGIRYGTKMGITNVSMMAEEFIAKHPNYNELCYIACKQGITPIFEYCSRKNRIVIDYPEDRLVLTALRYNDTGTYVGYKTMCLWTHQFKVEVVGRLDQGGHDDDREFLNFVKGCRGLKNEEGYVRRFEDGHMDKIKSDEYLLLHRAKSVIENEKEVLRLVLEDKTDDLTQLLSPESAKKLIEFQSQVSHDIISFVYDIRNSIEHFRSLSFDRKQIAAEIANVNPAKRAAIFNHCDSNAADLDYKITCWTKDQLLKSCSSNSGIKQKAYNILENARWS